MQQTITGYDATAHTISYNITTEMYNGWEFYVLGHEAAECSHATLKVVAKNLTFTESKIE